jgi:hypothetical protein
MKDVLPEEGNVLSYCPPQGGPMQPTATELQIVQVPIDDLHPDPANPRKISAEELDRLTRSVREFGFVQPVIARHDES